MRPRCTPKGKKEVGKRTQSEPWDLQTPYYERRGYERSENIIIKNTIDKGSSRPNGHLKEKRERIIQQ